MAPVSQPSPLIALRQRAEALARSADLAGAIDVLQNAVEFGKSRLGEDDPDVLVTAHQLARVHQRADDPSAARRVLEDAFAAGQWRLGDADPLMLEISFDLGVVAEELGNRHEARKAFTRVAENGPGVLGADHWAVRRANDYLGSDPSAVRAEQDLDPAAPPPAPAERIPLEPSPPRTPRIQDALTEQTVVQRAIVPAPPMWPAVAAPPPVEHFVAVPAPGAPDAYRRRGPAVFAAIAACLAAVIAVVALVFVLANRKSDSADDDGPVLAGAPPTDVRLDDRGSHIGLTWTDPAAGKTSFLVTGGHPGGMLAAMGQTGPGVTRYALDGLNVKLDYCFAVVAVYGTKKFASSPQVCTSRPRPATSR